jgi:hypothetical protein
LRTEVGMVHETRIRAPTMKAQLQRVDDEDRLTE